ncbi:uncharacterized protein LOC127131762 [Lathyrus oleraceus]|uniref:uncharacterized protein LOC127131762 n=1 Tax=Pisum sativum TaxID=3888 RepID=UPI0021D0B323|nr:uncharacterized protein LOC127131762 [Pisum sativum]
MLSSEAHRKALLKVLNTAYVMQDITVDQFDDMVANITASRYLGFNKAELPHKGNAHNKALHISVMCTNSLLSRVLVDTGSSLNVLLKATLSQLQFKGPEMKTNTLIVRAFDGSRRQVIGEVDFPICVGPHQFKDLLVSKLSSFRYVETDEGIVEIPLHYVEFEEVSLATANHDQSSATILSSSRSAKHTLEKGPLPGWGKVFDVAEKRDRFGISYRPSAHTSSPKKKQFNPIKFRSTDFQNNHTVAVIGESSGNKLETPSLIRRCPLEFKIPNWMTSVIPIVYSEKTADKTIDYNMARINCNSGFPINQAEDDNEEDCELPVELARLLEHKEKEIQPYKEPVDVINLGSETDKKEVKVGASLAKHVHSELVELLHEYVDVFAWSYQDMPGLDTSIVEHHLPLKLEFPLVKQKLRRTRPDMALKIKEDVKKQFNAGFLSISEYPQWVVNIVPVPKKDGKIKMSSEDMEKTTFITTWGTYCYKVMSFGLKNAGETYQHATITLFHDMIHEDIDVYVEDMIAKSITEEDHLVNLRKLFVRLRKFKLRLNLSKCTFGVRSGKLLGFIVSHKGIEVVPNKVRAIQ